MYTKGSKWRRRRSRQKPQSFDDSGGFWQNFSEMQSKYPYKNRKWTFKLVLLGNIGGLAKQSSEGIFYKITSSHLFTEGFKRQRHFKYDTRPSLKWPNCYLHFTFPCTDLITLLAKLWKVCGFCVRVLCMHKPTTKNMNSTEDTRDLQSWWFAKRTRLILSCYITSSWLWEICIFFCGLWIHTHTPILMRWLRSWLVFERLLISKWTCWINICHVLRSCC